MDIKHSRRLLILGAPDSGALDVIKGPRLSLHLYHPRLCPL